MSRTIPAHYAEDAPTFERSRVTRAEKGVYAKRDAASTSGRAARQARARVRKAWK